jgi:hypothetical protein
LRDLRWEVRQPKEKGRCAKVSQGSLHVAKQRKARAKNPMSA